MKSIILLGLAFALPLHAQDEKAPDKAKPKATPEESFKKKDTDGDGLLTLEEYVGKMTGEKKAKAEKSFSKKDKDKDGKLTLAEFSPKPKGPKGGEAAPK